MKLGTEVGLGPGHIALDGDQTPPRKGARQSSDFSAYFVAARSPISATAELFFILERAITAKCRVIGLNV